jgi:uncharacterized NAD(P)/FAD-binding protein YdhS
LQDRFFKTCWWKAPLQNCWREGRLACLRPFVNGALPALGHFPPSNPATIAGLHETNAYIANPRDSAALERAHGENSVAILSAGLTVLDALFRLTSSSDTRKIYLISRHGLFPQPHRFNPKPPAAASFPPFIEGVPLTVRAYFRALRLEIRENAANGGDWRNIINLPRPYTPQIWQRFPLEERKKFLSGAVALLGYPSPPARTGRALTCAACSNRAK